MTILNPGYDSRGAGASRRGRTPAAICNVFVLLLALGSALFAQSGARYLIITHDNFYDAVQPLARWKQQKGMQDTVVKLSQIGSSNTQIYSYIKNAYATWSPRPEFLLLVGSGYYLPAFTRGSHQDVIYTDNPFANMDTNCLADIPYGRLPCKTARQCSIMVAKTLRYERTPYVADSLWFRRATEAIADSGDADAPTYWADARTVAGQAAADGYVNVDSFSSSRGGNENDVVQSINQGSSFVLFRGEAGVNWISPFAVNPSSCNNPLELPIICSFTCQTEALNRYDTMIGDAWLKVGTPSALKGAVAFIGNTHSTSHVAAVRSAMTRGYFNAFFSDSITTLGKAALNGKRQIFTQFHDSIETMGFNLLGDPELNLWTRTPQLMTAVYDTVVNQGSQSYPVAVSDAGGPVANALVCLQQGKRLYQYGYTDSAGQVTFDIVADSAGTFNVTVTARNHIPVEGTARITDLTAIGESRQSGIGSAMLTVSPNPGRARFTIACIPGSIVTVYGANGRLVSTLDAGDATGSSKHAFVQWDATALPAGAYIVRASSSGRVLKSAVVQLLR